MRRVHIRNAGFPLVAGAWVLFSGCICPVEKPSISTENDKPVFSWSSGAAARLCVTDLDVECPPGPSDKMPAGTKAYWFVSARGASCFPDGIQPPVTYGQADPARCMFDESDQNGGQIGGSPLERGKRYRLGLAGFGGSPVYREFMVGAPVSPE